MIGTDCVGSALLDYSSLKIKLRMWVDYIASIIIIKYQNSFSLKQSC